MTARDLENEEIAARLDTARQVVSRSSKRFLDRAHLKPRDRLTEIPHLPGP